MGPEGRRTSKNESRIPRFRASRIPRFRASRIPRFRASRIPRFRASRIPRFTQYTLNHYKCDSEDEAPQRFINVTISSLVRAFLII